MGKSLFFQDDKPTQKELDSQPHKAASATSGNAKFTKSEGSGNSHSTAVLAKSRIWMKKGLSYLNSRTYHSDVNTAVALARLGFTGRDGQLTSTEYEQVCKEVRNIEQDKRSSRSAHKIMEEFHALGDSTEIHSMDPPDDGEQN